MVNLTEHHDTDETSYSPHSLLPAPEPKTYEPPLGYFYHNVAKHLVKDTVRIMMNGLHIDLDRVEELENTLDVQLARVTSELAVNPLVRQYLEIKHKKLVQDYIEDRKSKLRFPEDYIKPFKHNDTVHRSYFMHLFAQQYNLPQPLELVEGTSIPKWSAKQVKAFVTSRPVLATLLDGTISHTLVTTAMQNLASDKCTIYNQKYLSAIHSPDVPLPDFNPASPDQKHDLLTDILGFESDKFTDSWIEYDREVSKAQRFGYSTAHLKVPKNKYSWDRDNIERILKETLDDDVRNLAQNLVDYSFAAIVRNNFIKAFYTYTVDDRLYGQYKLLGAKTGRYTSSNPNMLNTPSTKSVFAKPIKQCFTAPKGFLIAAIDYSALEDRVMASLSRDKNKCDIFLQNLDGHCLNAYGYFKDEVAALMELTGDTVTDVKRFFELSETNKLLKDIRQRGKPATFGLSYGAYPPKVARTLKISIPAAESIFNAYHNELYPGITDYRENYVLPTAKQNGRIHLGLGFYIKSDSPDKDIRTLNNSTCQFWSILTALTINKLHQQIDLAGYENDIIVTSTIYDSIYLEVRNDPSIIKWLNDTIIPIMTTDFMLNQTIENEADLEIGLDWSSLHKLPHNASIEQITSIMETCYGK